MTIAILMHSSSETPGRAIYSLAYLWNKLNRAIVEPETLSPTMLASSTSQAVREVARASTVGFITESDIAARRTGKGAEGNSTVEGINCR